MAYGFPEQRVMHWDPGGHDHHHRPARFDRAFAVGVALNVGYILVEVIGGLWLGSLALLADAGHNLSDVIGLLMAWGAHIVARFRPSGRRTYGWRSTTIFAALGNGLLLVGAVGAVSYEAIQRLFSPPPIEGLGILAVASVGVFINSWTAWLLMKGRDTDLNIRSAFLHMAADAAVSGAVVAAGLAIHFTHANWLDPLLSLIVGVIILINTWEVLIEAMNLALHAVPSDVDLDDIRGFLSSLPGVTAVHDLHVWALSTTEKALTAHLIMPDPPAERDFAGRVARQLLHRFGIHHSTIQIDPESCGLVCEPLAEAEATAAFRAAEHPGGESQ